MKQLYILAIAIILSTLAKGQQSDQITGWDKYGREVQFTIAPYKTGEWLFISPQHGYFYIFAEPNGAIIDSLDLSLNTCHFDLQVVDPLPENGYIKVRCRETSRIGWAQTDLLKRNALPSSVCVMMMTNDEIDLVIQNWAMADPNNVTLSEKIGYATACRLKAIRYIDQQENILAIQYFTYALQIWPQRHSYELRGALRYDMGDYEGAIQDLLMSVQLVDSNLMETFSYESMVDLRYPIDVNKSLAMASIQVGDYDIAIGMLGICIKNSPLDGDLYLYRAIAKTNIKDPSACNDYRKALELGNTDAPRYIAANCNKR